MPWMMSIYMMSSDRYLKIGISKNIKQRHSVLEQQLPHKLRVIATCGPFWEDEARDIERRLLFAFKEKQTRGEWFELCPELLSLAAHMRRTNSVPLSVIERGEQKLFERDLARGERYLKRG